MEKPCHAYPHILKGKKKHKKVKSIKENNWQLIVKVVISGIPTRKTTWILSSLFY